MFDNCDNSGKLDFENERIISCRNPVIITLPLQSLAYYSMNPKRKIHRCNGKVGHSINDSGSTEQ